MFLYCGVASIYLTTYVIIAYVVRQIIFLWRSQFPIFGGVYTLLKEDMKS
ncbi:MAG: hypothetical protein AAFQ41_14615 [Cyanobacteria bacterium J06623_7]